MTESKIPGFFSFEVDAKAEDHPDFEILTFENGGYADEVLTYGSIVSNGRKLARKLRETGFGPGDVLALLMRNHPEFVYAWYATNVLGAVMLPIDPRVKGERLEFVLEDSKAKGAVFTSELMENVLPVLENLPNIEIIGVACKEGMPGPGDLPDLADIWNGPEAPEPDNRPTDLNAPMEIIYTSGTTGDPKGVVLKNSRLAPFGMLATGVFQYNENDKLYTGLSLTHGNAQAVTMIPSLYLGIPAVFSTRFTKSRIWDICRKYSCTTFSLLGGMLMGIFSEPEKPDDVDNPVRLVLSAGTPRVIWETFEKRFGLFIHEWYGAIEGGFAHKPPGVGPIGSFGKPLEGTIEMRVVREDDSECDPFETGEIVSRLVGQKTEVNYLGKKDASEKKTQGGWLRTGDMGHVDENGWFFFDYRAGGVLRRSGDFIQPSTVEAAFAKHPDITDVCVYGIPAASGAPGESDLVAAIVLTDGAALDIGGMHAHCKAHLDGNSIPSYLQVVDAIPKTASEKNLDRLLKEDFSKDADNAHEFVS
ncbi:MAG: AMP-binding protein [Thermodesulfobacteriota bacterium]